VTALNRYLLLGFAALLAALASGSPPVGSVLKSPAKAEIPRSPG
jgi:hypothetical protein